MKSEAVNSFNDGLVKDMNELNTPDKVLTDCLNGTLVTYNGNELSLQNDMGNARVDTSYLNPGYIPVGMKEYGGIIYVASYNPETKVGQIGSFPSPQQLYGDEKDGYELNISIEDFIRIDEGIPIVVNEFKRIPIFDDKVTDGVVTYREFHPGDRFIISGEVSETILKAIYDGVIRLRLASVSNSGEIEYIDDSKLKTYDHSYNDEEDKKKIVKLWIYPSDREDISTILRNDPDKIQIYASKNSGRLMVIIEFSLFDNFNLYREYSYDESKSEYTVKFTGKATGNLESEYIMYSDEDNSKNNSIGKELLFTSTKGDNESYNDISYSILPIHYIDTKDNNIYSYGALERLRKEGVIDINSLRENKDSLGSWSYYVGDTILTIDWSYDYFDVSQKEIESMRFSFIPLNGISELNKLVGSSTVDTKTVRDIIDEFDGGINVPILEPSYNGNFETIVPIGGNNQLKKDYIYVCRIDKKYIGESNWETGIFYKFIYTGTFFNTFTSKDIAGFMDERPVIKIKVDGEFETSSTATATEYYRNSNWIEDNGYETFKPLQSEFFVKDPNEENSYSFTTVVHREYNLEIKATAEFGKCIGAGGTYSLSEFAGYPSSTYLNKYFESITDGTVSYPEKSYSNPSLSSHLNGIEEKFSGENDGTISSNYNENLSVFTYKTSTSRAIYSSSGEVSTKSVQTEMLLPVYDPNVSESVLNFGYPNSILTTASGDEHHIRYNASTSGTTTYGGTDALTGGHDDVDLSSAMNMMGDGIVGILAGQNGDDASLKYEGMGNSHGWYRKDEEVDKTDNFLLATWRTNSDNHIVINMGTKKDDSSRLDKRIKAVLSQLLIAKGTTISISGIGPNSDDYTYHLPFSSSIPFTINTKEEDNIEFYLDSNDETAGRSIEALLKTWTSIMGEDLKNYLPVFSREDIRYEVVVQFGSDIKIDENPNIIGYYLNAYSTNISASGFETQIQQMSNSNNMKYNSTDIINETHLRKYIFIGQAESVDNNGVCKLSENSDGSPKVKCIAGSLTSAPSVTLYTGDAGNIRPCNINKYFSTLVKINNLYNSPIEISNEMLVTTTGKSYIGRWTKHADGHAPDLYHEIHFGTALIGNP